MLIFIEFLLKIAPVIVGGIIAIAGGFLGTWFTQKMVSAKEESSLRLKKIEELLAAATECEHWLEEYKNSRIGTEFKAIGHSPLDKVKYLCALYAPELNEAVSKLSLAHASYIELVAYCYSEKIKNGYIPDRFLTEYQQKFIAVSRAIDALIEDAVLYIENKKP